MNLSLPVASPEERARALLSGLSQRPYPGSHTWDEAVAAIAGAIRFAEEQEREACAKIAELAHDGRTAEGKAVGQAVDWDLDEIDQGIAIVIRARSNPSQEQVMSYPESGNYYVPACCGPLITVRSDDTEMLAFMFGDQAGEMAELLREAEERAESGACQYAQVVPPPKEKS